jgi:multiple sugar transport system substrate-binding protein
MRRQGVTRKELIVAGAGAYLGLVLGGCGGSSSEDGEITYWNGFTGGDGPTMLELVDAYTKESGTPVKMVSVRWEDFYQKVPAAVEAGRGPDVAIMHVDQIATSAAHRVLRPLDDVAQQLGLHESDFAPDVWNAGVYRERRYGIPLDMHPLAFYYNKAVLEEAGLDPDDPPADRESFESALDELKGKGLQGNWVSPFLFTGGFMFQTLLWQFGGDLTNEDGTAAAWDSDAGVEAMEYVRSFVARGWSPDNIAQDADAIAFKGGQNAFIWNGAWAVADYGSTDGLEWGVAPLPRIGDQPAAWSNSHQFVVTRSVGDEKLEAVSGLIDSITSSPSWATAGMVPARKAARETEEFRKLDAAAIAEEIPYVRFPRPIPGIGDVRESTLDVAIQQALSGEKPVREALERSADRATQLMEDNRQKFEASV